MYGLKWPFSLKYEYRDTRRIDFPRVDGLSTDTPVLGRHTCSISFALLFASLFFWFLISSYELNLDSPWLS